MNKYSLLVKVMLALLVSSCIGRPEFELTPTISFKSISNQTFDVGGGGSARLDSVQFTVSFTDGDGDLGIAEAEINTPPFNITLPDGRANPFTNNFFIDILRKENGVFVPLILPEFSSFNGRFPPLNDTDEAKPLEGDITYTAAFFLDGALSSPIDTGDTLKFQIQIADRRLRLSNRVETTEIVMGGQEELPGEGQ